MNQKGLNDMYETGVLVENPISAAKYFRRRMGYTNPDEASTKLVEASQYGFQANWRGQTFDKREYIAGVHNGEMPGADTNTDILQARAMNPYSAKSTNRMDYVNPSWQANVSQYGGNSGTIEMLASGFSRALPMAMDNLEQISANALDENKRQAINDPLSSTYAMVHQGIQEILANDRAARLAAFRGSGTQDQDVTIDMSRGDAENTFNTSYQGPNINKGSKIRENPFYQKVKRERDEIAEALDKTMTGSLERVYRPAGAPEPMKPKDAKIAFENDFEEKRVARMNEIFNKKMKQLRSDSRQQRNSSEILFKREKQGIAESKINSSSSSTPMKTPSKQNRETLISTPSTYPSMENRLRGEDYYETPEKVKRNKKQTVKYSPGEDLYSNTRRKKRK